MPAILRQSRNINTVYIDSKDLVSKDLETFLAQENRYHQAGIPYHRGYLFWGPPGTGKTSLIRALASAFGMEIRKISLKDSTLSDSSLAKLFSSIPRRCIIVLEDIDTWIHRRSELGPDEADKRKGISLSGLLNAIDGVEAPEGTVLIITTNYKDKLDSALIRPGRIDVEIQFKNATKHHARQCFKTIYASDKISQEELNVLAEKFVSSIKDYDYSLASIQEFLWKRTPERACEEVSHLADTQRLIATEVQENAQEIAKKEEVQDPEDEEPGQTLEQWDISVAISFPKSRFSLGS